MMVTEASIVPAVDDTVQKKLTRPDNRLSDGASCNCISGKDKTLSPMTMDIPSSIPEMGNSIELMSVMQ